jgi:hypothetical protein
MSPESNEEEMCPEYNIRGGVRGKYFDAYLAMRKQTESSVTIASNYFMTSTDGGNALGNDVGISREAVVPIVISPQIQFGVPAEVPAR